MSRMIPFYKYHGAGNDFIVLDHRRFAWLEPEDQETIAFMCDRRFGIGADGVIFLEKSREGSDFYMRYFNADGREGSMCGNGGRCIVSFAQDLGIVQEKTRFMAIDGLHEAKIPKKGWVELQMKNVQEVTAQKGGFFLDTGSPHQVNFIHELASYDVELHGRKLRQDPIYAPGGTNVNFVEIQGEDLAIRTYERGVEAETLACGTGVTAAALAFAKKRMLVEGHYETKVKAKGGELSVLYNLADNQFTDVWLCGPTQFVFKGSIQLAEKQTRD